MKNDSKKLREVMHTRSSAEWQKRGAKAALRLFHQTAKTVPAYQQFLKIHEISYRPGFNVYSDSNAKINAAEQRLQEQKIVKGLTKIIPDINWIVEIRRETIARQSDSKK